LIGRVIGMVGDQCVCVYNIREHAAELDEQTNQTAGNLLVRESDLHSEDKRQFIVLQFLHALQTIGLCQRLKNSKE